MARYKYGSKRPWLQLFSVITTARTDSLMVTVHNRSLKITQNIYDFMLWDWLWPLLRCKNPLFSCFIVMVSSIMNMLTAKSHQVKFTCLCKWQSSYILTMMINFVFFFFFLTIKNIVVSVLIYWQWWSMGIFFQFMNLVKFWKPR